MLLTNRQTNKQTNIRVTQTVMDTLQISTPLQVNRELRG